MPGRRLGEDARSAMLLAHRLVREGVDEQEAVARLRGMQGGRPALQAAAEYVGQYVGNGYPATRMNRLLLSAVGDSVVAPTAEAAAVEDRQQQLAGQPPSVSFQQLAEQMPALRNLEQRAREDPKSFLRELSPLERLLGGPRNRGAGQEFRVTIGMRKAVQRLVGPSSGQSDPVLSSPLAVSAVDRYLWEVAGIDPTTWRPSVR